MEENRRETKRMNKARVARLISEAGAISKNEVSARLGLSMPTTLQHVKELTEAGYVVENGELESMLPEWILQWMRSCLFW